MSEFRKRAMQISRSGLTPDEKVRELVHAIADEFDRDAWGAKVFTDAASAYGELVLTHIHKAVDHSQRYAIGEAHTNGIENFWSLFKRCIKGTYVAIAPYHVHRYLTEQVWRFNNRDTDDGMRFQQALMGVVGKRLTFRVLTAQDDAGFMGIK